MEPIARPNHYRFPDWGPQSRSLGLIWKKGELQVPLGALWQKVSFVHIIYACFPPEAQKKVEGEAGGPFNTSCSCHDCYCSFICIGSMAGWKDGRMDGRHDARLRFTLALGLSGLLYFLIYVAAVAPSQNVKCICGGSPGISIPFGWRVEVKAETHNVLSFRQTEVSGSCSSCWQTVWLASFPAGPPFGHGQNFSTSSGTKSLAQKEASKLII